MGHIASPPIPGIVGLLAFRQETAGPLMGLAEQLLRGPSPLTSAERELIAAVVSADNGCDFCHRSHAATACAVAGDDAYVESAMATPASLTPKMQALVAVARAVAKSGRAVSAEIIDAAKAAGADDVSIHDAVLVAAAFCMFNRYVDGLGAITPDKGDPVYAATGARLAKDGYLVGPGRPRAP